MASFLSDLRSGIRILTRSPGPATAAVLVLALGIGLSTAMFSIVHGVMYRGLPIEGGERLYHLEKSHHRGWRFVASRDYFEWRRQQTSFEALSAFAMTNVYLSDGHSATRHAGAAISADAFTQLRIRPLHGRLFNAADDRPGAEPVVLLGHRVWSESYGADPDIVGRSLLVDGRPATVIGVMPEGFRFPLFQDVWTPMKADPARQDWGKGMLLEVFGRLEDGVTPDQARVEMGLIGRRVAEAYPEEDTPAGVTVTPYTHAFMEGPEQGLVKASLGAVTFVLLIACANVANLLLARTAARSRELAIRSALGAGRGRVIAQILSESLCLAVPAAAAGLVLGAVGVMFFNDAAAVGRWPYWSDVRIDTVSLAIVLVLAGLSALASGLAPAFRASRIDAQAVLKSETASALGGFRIGRLSRGLVVLEVALSCVLLIGAGLLVRSILYLTTIDFEFRTEHTFTARLDLIEASYPDDESRLRFWERFSDELRAAPGVESVAFTSLIPGAFASGRQSYAAVEKVYADDKDRPWARFAVVSPGFFGTVGAEVLEGRDFTRADRLSSPGVVLVNRSFAAREWPESSALGQRLRIGRGKQEPREVAVIGVVPDLHMDGFRNRTRAGLYFPLSQRPAGAMAVMARTSGEPMAVNEAVHARLRALDATVPLYWAESLESLLYNETYFYRLVASIFSILGVAALVLAAVGLYGVMAFSVSRRTAEVGVRMALGAAARDVVRLVVAQGLRQMVAGIALGTLLAAAVTRLISSQLVGVEPLDPMSFGSVAMLLAGVGAMASLVPALRAANVDPVRALHCD